MFLLRCLVLRRNGFPAVNGGGSLKLFDANIPITISNRATGLNNPNTFASEFGVVHASSFESMSPTLAQEHWGLHAGQPDDTCQGGFSAVCKGPNVMAQRNYPMDNLLDVYWGTGSPTWLNTTGEASFKKQLWQSLIASALNIKSNIETRRQDNQFGIIVWQYGEIWPTGGWGSVEYSSPRPGQVLGGRWKPLQYWYRQSLYADVLVACGTGSCYVRNDRSMQTFDGTVTVEAVDLLHANATSLYSAKQNVSTGPGITQYFSIPVAAYNPHTTVLQSTVTDESGSVISTNINLLLPPVNLTVAPSNVKVTVADSPNKDGSVNVTVESAANVLWLTLTTQAQGRFSDNAFLLRAGSKTLQFIPFGDAPVDIATLKTTIREEDVSVYA
jgi:hypothetical protein